MPLSALCVPTREPLEFFAAGRRVPAGYTGLGIANSAMGATGIVAMTGIFFLIGFDALCLVIGGLAGFVIMAIMLAPFFRKFGAFTVPSYLGRRFESRTVRLLAAALLSVPHASAARRRAADGRLRRRLARRPARGPDDRHARRSRCS